MRKQNEINTIVNFSHVETMQSLKCSQLHTALYACKDLLRTQTHPAVQTLLKNILAMIPEFVKDLLNLNILIR